MGKMARDQVVKVGELVRQCTTITTAFTYMCIYSLEHWRDAEKKRKMKKKASYRGVGVTITT